MPSDRCRVEGNLKAFHDACVDWHRSSVSVVTIDVRLKKVI